jgi:DUF2075 family protein
MPGFDLRIYDDPESMENDLRSRHENGSSVRLLSSYSRKWVTRDAAQPHSLGAKFRDFYEAYTKEGKNLYWSRIWNYVPNNGNDYTWFVSEHPASYIARDPLCEVGCPYAVRGFDYDYVGILWLNDLIWAGGKWVVNAFAVEESGMVALTRAARDEAKKKKFGGAATAELLERVKQAYRILFTRALKGVYVYIPDQATRSYLADSLGLGKNEGGGEAQRQGPDRSM